MRSVAWRILSACLAVAAIAVGAVAYIASQATSEKLRAYVDTSGSFYAQRVAQSLGDYYARNGSGKGVESLLPSLARPFDERLVVADASGTVVADTAGAALGKPAAPVEVGQPTPIVINQQKVGDFYLPVGTVGRGPMGSGMGKSIQGSGQMGVNGTPVAVGPTPEEIFQWTVTRGILLGSGAAVVLAVLLSLLLTRQIVRPLNLLASASQRLAAGDLGQRVPVASRDEVGAVGQLSTQWPRAWNATNGRAAISWPTLPTSCARR